MAENQKGPLSLNAIELIQVCILTDISNTFTSSCLDRLFVILEEYIYSGLGIEECSQAAWDVLLIFVKHGSPAHILKVNNFIF
jgi:hypothetical protein